jgi:hypothetical protein
MLPDADREVLDDDVVSIRPSGSAGELEVFQPYSRVHLPSVLRDIGGWLEAWREWCFLDVASEGP